MPIKTVDDIVQRLLPQAAPPRAPGELPDPALLAALHEENDVLVRHLGMPAVSPTEHTRLVLLGAHGDVERLASHEQLLARHPALAAQTCSADALAALGELRNAATALKGAARPVAQQLLQVCHEAGAELDRCLALAEAALAAGRDLAPDAPYGLVRVVLGELMEAVGS